MHTAYRCRGPIERIAHHGRGRGRDARHGRRRPRARSNASRPRYTCARRRSRPPTTRIRDFADEGPKRAGADPLDRSARADGRRSTSAMRFEPADDTARDHRDRGLRRGTRRLPGFRPHLHRARAACSAIPARYCQRLSAPNRTARRPGGRPRLGRGPCRGSRLGRLRPRQRCLRRPNAMSASPSASTISVRRRSAAAATGGRRERSTFASRIEGDASAPSAVSTARQPDRATAPGGAHRHDLLRRHLVREGLVMIADTRTNAGVDNIATFRKLHIFEKPGERVDRASPPPATCRSRQSVLQLAERGDRESGDRRDTRRCSACPACSRPPSSSAAPSARSTTSTARRWKRTDVRFEVSMLLGGQIGGGRPRLFMIYSAGNFIEATDDTPYLQIGEHKYGKPILDRAVTNDTELVGGAEARADLDGFDHPLQSRRRHADRHRGGPPRRPGRRRSRYRIEAASPISATCANAGRRRLRAAHQAIPAPALCGGCSLEHRA